MIVSAYAAAPALEGWDRASEGRYLDAVTQLPELTGLELPFYGHGLHKYDEGWLLRRLPDRSVYVVTTIPDTVARHTADRRFGLASADEHGRRTALDSAARAAQAVRRLSREVVAVVFHSAGTSGRALCESVEELRRLDWGGARVVIEHCDAPTAGRPFAKGFLPLDAELEAGAGIVVNWGRSVLERRDPGAAVSHVREARSAGALAGVVVSGCAPVATPYGSAWSDSHVPPFPVSADSLLTPERIRAFLSAAGPSPGYLGLKVSAPRGSDVPARVTAVASSLALAARLASAPPPWVLHLGVDADAVLPREFDDLVERRDDVLADEDRHTG